MHAEPREQTAAGGERQQLRVTLASARAQADFEISLSSADRVERVAEAAAAELGDSVENGLWCERRGEQLDPGATVAEAGIRWGDRLLLIAPIREPTRVGGRGQVELVVSGGPCAGETFQLGYGSFRLGREGDVDIFVPDPSISRHHLDVHVTPEGVSVADAGSSNGTAIGGVAIAAGEPRRLQDDEPVELGRTMLSVRPLHARAQPRSIQRGGLLEFIRPPRVSRRRDPFSGELEAPPDQSRRARLPLAASLMPLAAGGILFALTKSPVMLAVAGLSPLMAVGTFISDRRGGKQSFARGSQRFRAKLREALEQLDAGRAQEEKERREEAPDAPALIARAADLAPTLWERRPGDEDFLVLRLGVADLPARSGITLREGGEESLRELAQNELESRGAVPAVPLTIDLAAVGVAGLSGPRPAVLALARWLVVQACVLHSPGDLVVMASLTRSAADEWDWLKWLPHARPDRLGLDFEPVAVGRDRGEALMSEIAELGARRAALQKASAPDHRPTQLIVLIDEDIRLDRSLLSATISSTAQHGVAFLWLGHDARDLPGQARMIVELDDGRATLSATDAESGTAVRDVSADGLSNELAERTARNLAPVRDVGELARSGDIPRRVGLLELLDLTQPTEAALRHRWESWRGDLRATVGVGADGPLTLDLRAEGPHALIAGTTGSGKSELLRTLVAAAAAAAPPDKVSFLLVDYKGGAAFAPCAALPHVVDIISDLDEHLAERALTALHAELKRRERILAEHGARDLLELSRRMPEVAPPLLVIAVDEFAKLREEVPEFVDGVVDIAQRGRSLGVHMVLAAQTLRNAFTSAIRANTNLRVALRVSEESESDDMISSPLAARIPSGESSRGRAFVRTGHGELREFQAAYVSGRGTQDTGELSMTRFDGTAPPRAGGAVGESDSDADSDLTALGAAARAAQSAMGLRAPDAPWLPLLPETLAIDDVPAEQPQTGRATVGLIDLPALQRQDPLVIDLPQAGNVAVFGTANSGRSTALRSIALGLAREAPTDELCLFGLDGGGGALAELDALAHCAAVVRADEEERVHRLLRTLVRRVEQPASDGHDARRFVLLLDDFDAFTQQYNRPGGDSPYQMLERILTGGRAARVHVVLSASRRGSVPASLASSVGQRLILRMTTEEELLSLGLDAKSVRGAHLPPGRGFTTDSAEFQIAVPARNGEPMPFAEAAAELRAERATGGPTIATLPERVSRDAIGRASSLSALPIGLADEDLRPAAVDLSELHLLVVGPYRSGRSTALETIALAIGQADPAAELHLLSPRRSSLRDRPGWASAARGLAECDELAAALLERVEAGEFEQRSGVLLIDDGGEISEGGAVLKLERLVRAARDSQLRIVASVETGAARGIGVSWIRELRREGHGLLLQPDLTADGDLLGVRLPRRLPMPLVAGRGFLVTRGSAQLLQTAS